jgi:phosphoglycolate phosphatase
VTPQLHDLVFDLDGTLTDPEPGITRCFVYALERLGLPAPDRSQLRRLIGPPLRDVFGELLATSDPVLIERAVAIYRERFGDVGLYENELYPGMAASVEHLAACGHRLFVATAKAEVYARRIIEHFRLGHYFAKVYGAALSGEGSHKSDLLARLLRAEAIDPRGSIMIGDRAGDITGARKNGMRSIGVLWGYGTAKELAEADLRVGTQAELIASVRAMNAEQ